MLALTGMRRDAEFAGAAKTLEAAYDAEQPIVALTIDDREAILRVREANLEPRSGGPGAG